MRIKNVNIINQLPIGIVGRVVHERDVGSLEWNEYGILVTEKKQFGGRMVLVNWQNITSIEVYNEPILETSDTGVGTPKVEAPDNTEPAASPKKRSPGRPRKERQGSDSDEQT